MLWFVRDNDGEVQARMAVGSEARRLAIKRGWPKPRVEAVPVAA